MDKGALAFDAESFHKLHLWKMAGGEERRGRVCLSF